MVAQHFIKFIILITVSVWYAYTQAGDQQNGEVGNNIKIKPVIWLGNSRRGTREYMRRRNRTDTDCADQCTWMSRDSDDHTLWYIRHTQNSACYVVAWADCIYCRIYTISWITFWFCWIIIIQCQNLPVWWCQDWIWRSSRSTGPGWRPQRSWSPPAPGYPAYKSEQ